MRYDPANNPEDETGSQGFLFILCLKKNSRNSIAIRYLEFCVKKIRSDDEAIHNYLLSLYCQSKDQEKVSGRCWCFVRFAKVFFSPGLRIYF